MPYKLRKSRGKDLYWVVNKETGKKYSHEPLPKERAEAQMRALYASENKPQDETDKWIAPIVALKKSKKGGMEAPRLAPCEGEAHTGECSLTAKEISDLRDILEDEDVERKDVINVMKTLKPTLSHEYDKNLLAEAESDIAGKTDRRSIGTTINKVITILDRVFPSSSGSGKCGSSDIPSCMKLSVERGAGKTHLNMFELFKGTGSIGKVAKRMGFNVISLDFDPIYTPDIETDILKWDYKKWADENNFIPDYIWASPPCNTYSTLAYRLKERDTKTAEPKSARAREGTAILHRTLDIIKYFKSKNPKLLYTIENPRGMMRHDKEIKKLPNRETTLYCLYGDFKRKPTDFWSNFPMGLKPHTEKCNREGVVANLANLPTIEQRYSIPSKLVRKILGEAKEQYGDEPMMGAGFFGDLWNAAKSVGKKVVGTIRNVVSTGVRQDYPPYVRSLLSQIGNLPITEMYVRREPIQSLLNKALNFITRGKWSEAKSKYSYDSLFHLGLEVVVRMSESNNINKRYVIEKNAVIEISPAKAFEKDTEIMPVPMNGQGHTINGLLNGARAVMGAKFFPYDPFQNNCQDFIMGILTGNGLGNQDVYNFVKQPIEELVKELPSYTGKVAKTITDLGGLVNTAIYGQGGMNPSRKFARQLKKWNVNPTEYLMKAKAIAKKKGLPENMLGFSSDDKHKLQMPNADGKIIRFGATGLGDYILYTLSKNPEADEHRRKYLARATKIKGDWKQDPFSPNNLAINILW